jgi:hypothetical protein
MHPKSVRSSCIRSTNSEDVPLKLFHLCKGCRNIRKILRRDHYIYYTIHRADSFEVSLRSLDTNSELTSQSLNELLGETSFREISTPYVDIKHFIYVHPPLPVETSSTPPVQTSSEPTVQDSTTPLK